MPTSFNAGVGYFVYVGDISEVYNYNVPQGNAMYFMNKNQPYMYLKSVNMFNQQTVTAYRLTQEDLTAPAPVSFQSQQQIPTQPVSPQPSNEYVTRGELTSIIQETIRNEMRNNRKNYNKKED